MWNYVARYKLFFSVENRVRSLFQELFQELFEERRMKLSSSQLLVVQFVCIILSITSFSENFTAAADSKLTRRERDFFEKRIRPVLVKHCYECHSAKSEEAGGQLFLDTRMGSRTGGESGPAVVPKNIKKSLLVSALEYDSIEMPPEVQLPANVIADFKRWIKMGAPDPRDGKMPTITVKKDISADAEKLWSLKPIVKKKPPSVRDESWPRSDFDRFIVSRLDKQNLKPVADAKPVTLLRRLSFDLVGLPSRAGHINRVLADPSQKTFKLIVDELIASPQFGERWARHWLDVARYAESAGGSRDVLMPFAWKYRDYVIDAFNADMPYPQFITEQIAGDLLPSKTVTERTRKQIATGFLAIGQKSLNGGNVQLDIVDDQIDVIGKSVLGLAVSCARCHDHKFDPIPTQDYYALAGIFLSTETLYGGNGRKNKNGDKSKVYLAIGENAEEAIKVLNELSKQRDKLFKERQTRNKKLKKLAKRLPDDWKSQKKTLGQLNRNTESEPRPLTQKEQAMLKQIEAYEKAQTALKDVQQQIKKIDQQEKSAPAFDYAVGVREGKKISNTSVRIRGERTKNGDVIPRGFLKCINLNEAQAIQDAGLSDIDSSQSGRLQLAAWLTHAENPLPARVAANRIWMHLFGRGIVKTTDNFGVNSLPPTHPDLLDFIASRFIEHGWSTKKLVREIVMSRTYQLSCNNDRQNYLHDQSNKYYWRQNQRRLEAEAIRDAMMACAGSLEFKRPQFGSTVAKIGEGEIGRGRLKMNMLDEAFPYRSVYLPIIRGVIPESLNKFDFPDPSNPQSVRDTTNVPEQSLYFMNSSFVIEQAEKTASRVVASGKDRSTRIQHAYMLILSRSPTESESQRIGNFLDGALKKKSLGDDDLQTVWKTVCQSLFASAEFRFLN